MAAICSIPNPEPTVVSARPITFNGQGSIHALAFVDEGAPALPALLFSGTWLRGVEETVARHIGFSDPQMRTAKRQAWVASRFLETGRGPHLWLAMDRTTGTVESVIACPAQGSDSMVCIANRPIKKTAISGLLARVRAQALGHTSTEVPESGAEENGSEIEGHIAAGMREVMGYVVAPAPAGVWMPVLGPENGAIPQDDGLGLWMGGSVGLAYSLAYIEHLGGPLAPEGMTIAATGTLSVSPTGDMRVGRILGLTEKIEGARAAGVNVVFIPESQITEAALLDLDEIEVVGVTSPVEAVAWLCHRGSKSKYCQDLPRWR